MSVGHESWMGCARWLRELNVLTTDKNGTVIEFASIFRDGILLCRLANILVPNAINQNSLIKATQQSQFTCTNNIRLFVDFCKSHFNLTDSQVFDPDKFYRMDEFQQMLKTLSILSNTEESISKGAHPFPERDTSVQSTSSSPQFVDDEDIYQSLPTNIDSVKPDETIYGPITSVDPEEKQSEQVYDKIVTNRKPSMNENDLQNTPTLKRNRCIRELHETEERYVRKALSEIITFFYEKMIGIISTEDYKIMFGNIEDIYRLHINFLADLEYPVKLACAAADSKIQRPTSLNGSDVPKTIGEVFIKYRDQFLLYGKYCSNLTDSRKLVTELIQNNEFVAKTIDELAREAQCKFGLNDLLCVPFQRITKYPLLLRELLKKTDVNSPDLKSLSEAVDVMEDVCAYINEDTRDMESKMTIDRIETSITDLAMPLNVKLHDYGRVNFDGEVKMAESTATSYGKAKPRFIFLFDKVIVVCKPTSKLSPKDKTTGLSTKTNTFTYKNAYVMSELHIDQNVSIDTKSGGTITRRTQFVIHMHRDRTDSNEITQLTFFFKNEVNRQNWMKALLLSKSNVCPTDALRDSNHKVSFSTFRVDVEKPLVCGVCERLMKGRRYQGYKCEACEMIMHKDCLGLKKCEPTRRSSHEPRSSHSFNSNRPRHHQVCEGDIVTANTNFTPSDLSFLQFSKGDSIEIIKMQGHNRFTGCLANNRNRTGLVHLDQIMRSRTTSMIGLSPMDSPAGSIIPRIARNESTVLPKKVLSDPWYMGEMERAKAESTLRGTPNGTFLVRYSTNRKQTAISLSYKNDVKHMIIEKNPDGKMYLDEDYVFNSTVELVQYYRDHNLIEIFQALDTCLKTPYSQCKVYKAIHDYDPPQPNSDGKFLTFKMGDIIVLLDTVGEDRGWWKGQVNNKTGFFPLTYVKPLGPLPCEEIEDHLPPSSSNSAISL